MSKSSESSESEKPENPFQKLFKSMVKSIQAAHRTRPDIDPRDMLAQVGAADGAPQSIPEFNASGEEMCFISMRCSVMPEPVVPGSSQIRCDGCGEAVWISPKTLSVYNRITKKKMHCMECMMAAMPKEERKRLQHAVQKEIEKEKEGK